MKIGTKHLYLFQNTKITKFVVRIHGDVKCFGKVVKQGQIYDVIFQSSSKQFQSNISRPDNYRNF